METILIVEDDRTYARATANWLARNGMDARYVLSADAAKEFLGNNGVDLVLSDFRLGDCNGVELLEWMRAHGYRMPFLVMTGYGDIPGAVEAVKKGADNYLPKPVQTEEVLGVIRELLERKKKKNKAGTGFLCLQKPVGCKTSGDGASGSSCGQPFRADTRGVGTGKEWVARQIHAFSKRSAATFVAVDCGALPRELAASELFGHKKGAFTGAVENKSGVFAAADHGTLFLDEVGNPEHGDTSAAVACPAGEALQTCRWNGGDTCGCPAVGGYQRGSGTGDKPGTVREDLFHRLNEFPLHVPPLIDCREDIIPLAGFFLSFANEELEKKIRGFDRDVREAFVSYPWPGNIRELKKCGETCMCIGAGWLDYSQGD